MVEKDNKFTGGALDAKDSRKFGWKSNGKVCFGFFRLEYSGSPMEVVHLFRSEYCDRDLPSHFSQTDSLPFSSFM